MKELDGEQSAVVRMLLKSRPSAGRALVCEGLPFVVMEPGATGADPALPKRQRVLK
jgi:hypothetical protein